jgi:hypothetical protein
MKDKIFMLLRARVLIAVSRSWLCQASGLDEVVHAKLTK